MGIDIDVPLNNNQETLLHLAARNGSKNAVLLLLSNNANVNAIDKEGGTPIMSASYRNHTEVVKILLANNATINGLATGCIKIAETSITFKISALSMACFKGHHATLLLLIRAGGSVNPTHAQEVSPLYAAVISGHMPTIKTLLTHGARTNQVSGLSSATTELTCATKLNHADTVLELLQAGANPSTCIAGGDTALHVAAKCDHAVICKLLLEAGADNSIKNNTDNLPIDLAPKDSGAYKVLSNPEYRLPTPSSNRRSTSNPTTKTE